MNSSNCVLLRLVARGLYLPILVALLAVAPAGADEWYELNDKALETFDVEGMQLPTTPEELQRAFPTAQPDHERVDEAVGLRCYAVRDLPSADVARFYFYDGRLYQFEAKYSLERVAKLGGAELMLQKLIDKWGPVDHAGERRWTWQRHMWSRRADFYNWPDRSAQLTITDMDWMPIVSQRIYRTDVKQPRNLGVE